ncbi:FecR family protein [Patescibacteria group bacterium]|jgi:hypothetical protein|nr:FecR family protein [Patescibacteria group bacterium]
MNQKRLLSSLAGALVVLLAVVFFGWFWSLGSVHAGPPPAIQVEVVKPSVEWRHPTEEKWTVLTDPAVVLPGDRVRTGAEGEARIIWGDRGYTRIDPNSEIVIEETPLDGTLTPGASISVRVESGRVWSRMLKLLDLDSSMEVKTSDVVATVRGTTFGIVKEGESEIAVAESVVEVASADGRMSTLVRDNQWGRFGSGAVMREMRDLRADDLWAQGNMRKDKEDDEKVFGAMREFMMQRSKEMAAAPRFLVDASERLHLRVASAGHTPALAALYAERRLAGALMEKKDQDWKAFAEYAKQAGPMRGALLGRVHLAVALNARREGITGLSRERGMRRELADPTEAGRGYLDALGIDERIDDAILREQDRSPERLQSISEDLDIFDARIQNMEADASRKTGLNRKAEAMRKRLDYAIALAQNAPLPPPTPEPAPEILQGAQIPDPTKPKPPVIKPPTTPTTQPTAAVYQRLVLLASPSIVELGQTVRLTLFGVTAEGQSDDLTSRAAFSTGSSADGSFSGNYFRPAKLGTVKVNAAYTDQNGTRATGVSITVNPASAPATTGLQRISIAFTGPTTLPCNGRSPFKVIATYADGKTQDVTMLSKFTVSDSKIIFVSDGVVTTFCVAQATTATMGASYTEGSVTKTASAVITLDPEPPPATSGGGGGTRYPYLY